MNDKERVLQNIIRETSGLLNRKIIQGPIGAWSWLLGYDIGAHDFRPVPQFIPIEQAAHVGMPLVSGDIVQCRTNPRHDWGISELVELLPESSYLVREIGTERECKISNEFLYVLRFMPPELVLTGKRYQLWVWAWKSFSTKWNKEVPHRASFGGCVFEGPVMKIWIRAHIFCADGPGGTHAQPKLVTMEWNKKTRLKDIKAALLEQGLTTDFEYTTEEPTYETYSKESLRRIMG